MCAFLPLSFSNLVFFCLFVAIVLLPTPREMFEKSIQQERERKRDVANWGSLCRAALKQVPTRITKWCRNLWSHCRWVSVSLILSCWEGVSFSLSPGHSQTQVCAANYLLDWALSDLSLKRVRQDTQKSPRNEDKAKIKQTQKSKS